MDGAVGSFAARPCHCCLERRTAHERILGAALQLDVTLAPPPPSLDAWNIKGQARERCFGFRLNIKENKFSPAPSANELARDAGGVTTGGDLYIVARTWGNQRNHGDPPAAPRGCVLAARHSRHRGEAMPPLKL